MSQEILSLLMGRTTEDDPDASGSEYLLFFESKGGLQTFRDSLRKTYSLTHACNVLNQDSELVSAKTCSGVFGA